MFVVHISDVAKRAGVAKSTVSKVLNHYDMVSEETRKKVEQAVEELGYIPNSVAVSLSKKKFDRVGLIVDIRHNSQFLDEISMQYLKGAFEKAKEFSLEVVTFFSSQFDEMNMKQVISYLRSQRITCLIIYNLSIENQNLHQLVEKQEFCSVLVDSEISNSKPWEHHQVSNEEFYGGDLQGIIDKLDYLEDLGVNGIYLTPIFESETSHKYDTKDYRKIDPHFGDQKTLIELVKTAHAKGIRVMLDGVFNHSGHLWQPWQDVLEKGPDSKYYEWFMINKWPLEKQERSTKNGDFYSFAFTSRMPKLNTNHPEVIAYLLETVKYWMDTFGVDGLRLDVANEISHQFCKELRKLVKRRNPEFFLLGEIWNDSIQWLRGDEFDSVMNYPLSNAIADFWIYQDRTSFDFECAINQSFTMYMQQTNDVLFNLLDSHDTNRLMNKVGDLDVFYQQLAVLFTMPGSPCIYYGTEIAMEGGHDPDCRRCMPWDSIQQGVYQERIEILKQLIRCRKEYDSFRSAHFHFESNAKESRQIHFIKTDNQGGQIEVILNCTLNESLVEQTGTVLFSRKYENGVMLPKGILIRKLD